MASEDFESTFTITGRDFNNAGRASTTIKDTLKRIGVCPAIVRRVAIISYETEMNLVMYAHKGKILLRVSPCAITIEADDEGPGIEDVSLAMQEGYSTATPEMREMGFGAGMGLPNIRKNADEFDIASELGRGTHLCVLVHQA
jgi:serine/threonine-protein kinase RsbT